jgi:hypothetical protein
MAPSRKSVLIALHSGSTGTVTITPACYAADANGDMLNFGPPSSGAIEKTSDVWSGVVAASGVAGYFRIVQINDDGLESETQRRIQGAVSTSGSELDMDNTSLTAGKTHTVDDYSYTIPEE